MSTQCKVMEEAEHCLKFGKLVDHYVARHLVAHIKRQETDNAALRADIADARATINKQTQDLTALRAENAALRTALTEMLEEFGGTELEWMSEILAVANARAALAKESQA